MLQQTCNKRRKIISGIYRTPPDHFKCPSNAARSFQNRIEHIWFSMVGGLIIMNCV